MYNLYLFVYFKLFQTQKEERDAKNNNIALNDKHWIGWERIV